jgi:hypothetical protein
MIDRDGSTSSNTYPEQEAFIIHAHACIHRPIILSMHPAGNMHTECGLYMYSSTQVKINVHMDPIIGSMYSKLNECVHVNKWQ